MQAIYPDVIAVAGRHPGACICYPARGMMGGGEDGAGLGRTSTIQSGDGVS
jgi:hypothetical protein